MDYWFTWLAISISGVRSMTENTRAPAFLALAMSGNCTFAWAKLNEAKNNAQNACSLVRLLAWYIISHHCRYWNELDYLHEVIYSKAFVIHTFGSIPKCNCNDTVQGKLQRAPICTSVFWRVTFFWLHVEMLACTWDAPYATPAKWSALAFAIRTISCDRGELLATTGIELFQSYSIGVSCDTDLCLTFRYAPLKTIRRDDFDIPHTL